MRLLKYCGIFFLLLTFFSCSLSYRTQTNDAEENVPDLTFSGTNFTRYEDTRKTVVFTADKIEQYNDGTTMYAKNMSFSIFDKDGKEDSSGSCNLMSANTGKGIYELFDNIEIKNNSREILLKANALRWNEKTEQIIGSTTDTVSLIKNNTTLAGKSFSASAVSNSFSFGGNVAGKVVTEDITENEEAER